MLPEEQIRWVVLEAVVDTGASQLMLPEDVVAGLGLPVLRSTYVTYADGRREELPVAGVVTVRVAGREANVDCIVGAVGSEILLGQVPLESLDLLVDCGRQELVPRPESPRLTSYKLR
jgi:clan AA aspartic protease